MKKLLCFAIVASLAIIATLPALADPLPVDEPDQKVLIRVTL